MTQFNFICYNAGSNSATNLAANLKCVGLDARRFDTNSPMVEALRQKGFTKNKAQRTINIKWGNVKDLPEPPETQKNLLCLNWSDTQWCTNKLEFFLRFSGHVGMTPAFFTNWVNAQSVLDVVNTTDSPILVERSVLSGHSGEGIRLLKHGDSVDPSAKLWTIYKKKQEEYRVHFFRIPGHAAMMYYQKKLLVKNPESCVIPNRFQVRNHQNGWVYSTQFNNMPNEISQAAQRFINSPQNTLDFGAIDIIWNQAEQKAYILEVNTAPGLTGSTLNWYKNTLISLQADALLHDWDSEKTKVTPVQHTAPAYDLDEEPLDDIIDDYEFDNEYGEPDEDGENS